MTTFNHPQFVTYLRHLYHWVYFRSPKSVISIFIFFNHIYHLFLFPKLLEKINFPSLIISKFASSPEHCAEIMEAILSQRVSLKLKDALQTEGTLTFLVKVLLDDNPDSMKCHATSILTKLVMEHTSIRLEEKKLVEELPSSVFVVLKNIDFFLELLGKDRECFPSSVGELKPLGLIRLQIVRLCTSLFLINRKCVNEYLSKTNLLPNLLVLNRLSFFLVNIHFPAENVF